MLGLFIIGLAGTIACYVNQGELERTELVEGKLYSMIHEYNTSTRIENSWDLMQSQVICIMSLW